MVVLVNGGQYRICLPVIFLTENACRPGSRFLPLVLLSSNKNIAAAFKSCRAQSSLRAYCRA